MRRRLSDERRSVTHKFVIAGHAGFITVGLYDDGRPGEIFLRMSKGGSVVSGLMDAFAVSTSIALQYGVPLKVLVNKFAHVRFEPSGFTPNVNIRIAKSLVDYIFRWLAIRFLSPEEQLACGVNLDLQTLGEKGESDVDVSNVEEIDRRHDEEEAEVFDESISANNKQMNITDAVDAKGEEVIIGQQSSNSLTMSFDVHSDAPVCDTCGALMVRNGACYKCLNCGNTSGCS